VANDVSYAPYGSGQTLTSVTAVSQRTSVRANVQNAADEFNGDQRPLFGAKGHYDPTKYIPGGFCTR
jgi:hypothetical protein